MADEARKQGLVPKRSQPLIQGVAPAPLVGLRAQLQRARQDSAAGQRTTEVQATKLGAGLQNYIKNRKLKNSGVRERAAADVAEPIQNESDKLAASQAALERKSRLYDAIARGEADAGPDYEVDFSTRLGRNAPGQAERRCRSPSPPTRPLSPPRRSPSPQYSSDDDSPTLARRQSPTYEPFQAHDAAEPSYEDGQDYDGYAAPRPTAPLSEHERILLERKQGHHDAFEARRELREHEEALEEHRKNIIKEKVAAVHQEVAAERQAGTSKKRTNAMDDSRRKALLKQVVAKKVLGMAARECAACRSSKAARSSN